MIVHFIDSSLTIGKLQQENLKDAAGLKAFVNEHCHSSHYLYQIKKCTKNSCSHCSKHPVRLPQDEFEKLNFIPLPFLNSAKDHYKMFTELYGQCPSEKDRPSLAPTPTSLSVLIAINPGVCMQLQTLLMRRRTV